jgi:hypothetical protein
MSIGPSLRSMSIGPSLVKVHVHWAQPKVHVHWAQPKVHVHWAQQPKVHVHWAQPKVHVHWAQPNKTWTCTIGCMKPTTSTLSTYYRQKRFCSTSARCKVRPRAQILIIPRPHSQITILRKYMNLLLKWIRRPSWHTRVVTSLAPRRSHKRSLICDVVTTRMKTTSWWNFSELLSWRVFHLTWLHATLYKYMAHRLFPLHCTLKPKVILPDDNARGEGKAGHCSGYPRNYARFRQGIERGYRSENGPSVRMQKAGPFLNRAGDHRRIDQGLLGSSPTEFVACDGLWWDQRWFNWLLVLVWLCVNVCVSSLFSLLTKITCNQIAIDDI